MFCNFGVIWVQFLPEKIPIGLDVYWYLLFHFANISLDCKFAVFNVGFNEDNLLLEKNTSLVKYFQFYPPGLIASSLRLYFFDVIWALAWGMKDPVNGIGVLRVDGHVLMLGKSSFSVGWAWSFGNSLYFFQQKAVGSFDLSIFLLLDHIFLFFVESNFAVIIVIAKKFPLHPSLLISNGHFGFIGVKANISTLAAKVGGVLVNLPDKFVIHLIIIKRSLSNHNKKRC